jgi:hypothetical protein
MLLLSASILITEKPLYDDAFKILLDYLKHADLPKQFTFHECQMMFEMIKQNGMIREGKTYIHYLFLWQDDEWYLNASDYFDKLCKKHSIYPKYLNIGQTN